MNRIIIAIVMILISGTICGFEVYTVNTNVERYIKGLNDVDYLTQTNRYAEAKELSDELLKSWKVNSRKLDKYLYHDYVDNITESMSALPIYAENKDDEAAKAIIEDIKIQLTSLKESELPYMHNIL